MSEDKIAQLENKIAKMENVLRAYADHASWKDREWLLSADPTKLARKYLEDAK